MLHLKKLKIILKYKYLFFILLILLSLLRSNIKPSSKYYITENNFNGIITEYTLKKDYITFILKGKEKIKCNYYLKEGEIININYGDVIILTGDLKEPTNNTIPNIFNYKKYLKNNNINYILTVDKISEIKKTNNILYKIKNLITDRINSIDDTGYLNTFILGNKNYIDDDVYNKYQMNGVLHIFSISGMHVSILASIILFILNKINKNKYNILIVILFLFFYLILTNYQASITRSIVFYSLLNIFKIKKINIDTKDTLLLSISLILLVYPKFINNIGFLYSSIISFSLIYYKNKFNKSYLTNILIISTISFLVSLPITASINYKINLLGIIINLFFVPLVSFILYPLSLLTFIIPSFYSIFNLIIRITELVSNYVSNITIFNIVIPKLNMFTIIIYYLILYLSLSKNKYYFILLVLLIIITKNINIIDSNYYIYYLDVKQGDMILLKYKDNVTVIDSGPGNFYNNTSNIQNYIKFFNSLGITHIKQLIFTHGDYDHMGEAINLVNNFKVEKVIFNCGEFNDLEKELIKVLDKKKIPYYSCIKELNIDNNKLYFLNNKLYDNENDNSSVIYTELNNHKFLFMGDVSVEVEADLIEKYNLKDIDVLKVGHHGSKTSSGKAFIDEMNPKYSIISVGKNNLYGHPNKEVLENLKDSKIYRTDKDGSVMFKIKNNKLKIETCSP